MSDQEVTLDLKKREIIRKGLNKLKKDGQLPAVIQNEGKESIIVSANTIDIQKVYKQVGKRHPVSVKVDNKEYLTIIKEVDFDPKKHQMRHVVFSTIKQDEKVETEVPVELVGDAPAAKLGLIIEQHLDDVQIEAFPKDLPDQVTVSIEGLEKIGDKITVADIIIPKGVTILTEPEHSIAVVEEHIVKEEETPAEEEPVEAATESAESETPAEESN